MQPIVAPGGIEQVLQGALQGGSPNGNLSQLAPIMQGMGAMQAQQAALPEGLRSDTIAPTLPLPEGEIPIEPDMMAMLMQALGGMGAGVPA